MVDALIALAEASDDLEPAVTAIEAAIVQLSTDDRAKLSRAAVPSPPMSPPPAALRAACLRIDEAFKRGRQAA